MLTVPSLNSVLRIRIPIGTLALLLAVFSWGLEYKTSLYHSPGKHLHTNTLPPAKLLTEAERDSSSKNILSAHLSVSRLKIGSPQVFAAPYEFLPHWHNNSDLLAFQAPPPDERSRTQRLLRAPPLS